MTDEVIILGGRRVFSCAPDGPRLNGEADALDLLGSLWGLEVDWLAVPVDRLGPDFLNLRTGVAGAIVQKMVNYRQPFAVVGDISAEVAESTALRDFVRESNEGEHAWFAPDMETFAARLAALR